MDARVGQIASGWDGALPGDSLRVGRCRVDVARRTVLRPDGSGKRLTVKALHVLLALVEADGAPLSREALLARVWPRTLPSDEVLTQAVAQLRKAFQDPEDDTPYIETLARLGYRLLAPVQWERVAAPVVAPVVVPAPAVEPAVPEPPVEAAADAPSAEAQPSPEAVPAVAAPAPAPAPLPVRRRRAWWPWSAAALLLVLALAVLATVPGAEAPPPPPPSLDYRAIISGPAPERWPRLSPDGRGIAFAQPDADGRYRIRLGRVGGSGSRPLSSPGPGEDDRHPAWSADGRKLAFLRTGPGGCQVVVAAVDEEGERVVGDCAGTDQGALDWLPDGRGVVMAACQGRGAGKRLQVLDLASGQWRPLAYDSPPGSVDSQPRYSPDGQWLGFVRGTTLGDLWIVPAAGGTPRRVTAQAADIRGWDWLPDSRGMVFSLLRDGGQLFHLDLDSGRTQVLATPAPHIALYPDVAAAHWSMVMEFDQSRTQMRRFPGRGGEGNAVFPSTGVDVLPAPSPDGRQVAFISDRSLATRLWLGELDHPATLRAVEGMVPLPRHPPVWTADGRRVLVIGHEAGRGVLYEVDVANDQVRQLPVPHPSPVSVTPLDRPDRLLVGVDAGQGRLQLVLYALPEWEALARVEDVAIARLDPERDRVCFTRVSRTGFWCSGTDLARITEVPTAVPVPADFRHWGWVAGQGFVRYGAQGGCGTWLAPMEAGQGGGRCLLADRQAEQGGVTADGDGRWLYLTVPREVSVDVGWSAIDVLRPGLRGG